VKLQQLERCVADYFGAIERPVAAVYLFGSVAQGTATVRSDVDLALLFSEAPRPTLLEYPFAMEADLSLQLGRPVQIVVMNDAPPDLVHRILRDGRLLVERDRNKRIEFEVNARNEYFDLLPFLRRYRREGAGA
jgi:predicted nucleotidyltransferase